MKRNNIEGTAENISIIIPALEVVPPVIWQIKPYKNGDGKYPNRLYDTLATELAIVFY